MFCSKCGAENADGTEKCAQCGAALSAGTNVVELVATKGALLNGIIDGFIGRCRKIDWCKHLDNSENLANIFGVVAFYILGVIGFVGSIVGAVRYEEGKIIWVGVCWLLACVLFSYFGSKLLSGIKMMILHTPSKFSSPAFLDCQVVSFIVSGIATLFFGVRIGIELRSVQFILSGILGFIIFAFMAICAIAPKTVSTEVGENCSVGEELIGVISFFIKSLLRIFPFVWCFGAVGVALNVIFHLGADSLMDDFMLNFYSTCILGFLPIFVYLLFLFYYFMIDIARAVLVLPSKLDELKKK